MIGVALIGLTILAANSGDYRVGSWQCQRDESMAKPSATCWTATSKAEVVRFSRSSDGISVIAKPACRRRAFWNAESVSFGPLLGRRKRSAEVIALFRENFESAVEECIAKPGPLHLNDSQVAAVLDATDWVDLPPDSVPTQKKH